jgi:hypothetical protein
MTGDTQRCSLLTGLLFVGGTNEHEIVRLFRGGEGHGQVQDLSHDLVKLNGFVEKSNGNNHKARYKYLIC